MSQLADSLHVAAVLMAFGLSGLFTVPMSLLLYN
jgi:hypothetical protein